MEGGEVSIRKDKTALRRLDAMWEDSQVALRAPPTAQVAPKVLARGVHALLVLLMRVAQYQVLLSRLCIPVGALGAHSGKRGMLEAKGGADCEGRGSARIVGSLAKRESDMEVKYSPQSLKSKERPITGVLFYEESVHASIRSLMSSISSSVLRTYHPMSETAALGTQRAVAISPTGKTETRKFDGVGTAGVGAPRLAKDGGFGL